MILETATVNLKRPFQAQRAILQSSARFLVLAIGRQWGKSELALIDGVHRLLRGENQWYCSPTNKNNKRMYPKFKAALKSVPGLYTHDGDMLIRMPTGAFIQFVSLEEPDNLRGEGLHHLKIDEAAFIRHGVWDKVLRPMLAAKQGGAWFMSSPNGRNEFWQWYQRGLDPSEPAWASFHAVSGDSPVLNTRELEDIRRNTPERVFEQEYMAAFLDDGGAVFRNIHQCITPAPETTTDVVFGVDWGRYNDYTVIVAMDVESKRVVAIDRFNKIEWSTQRGRLAAMAEWWKPQMIFAEENSIGGVNIEALQHDGLPVRAFTTTSDSKAKIINALALAFERGDIGILDDPALIGELQAFSLERLPSGKFRYSAPAGLHDDMVIALALAWHGVLQGAHDYKIIFA